jgi:Mg2+-importing ATPase
MVLRSRKPFYRDMPGNYLLFASLFVAAMALFAIYSPLNSWLGFVALKPVILISIVTIIGLYVLAAEFTKKLFLKKHS